MRLKELPAECWVSNRQLSTLSHGFLNAGGQIGVPRRTNGEADPAQASGGWVGTYAPDPETARAWQNRELEGCRNKPQPA